METSSHNALELPLSRDELRVLYDMVKYHPTADDIYRDTLRYRVVQKIATAIHMLGSEEGDVNGSL